MSAFSLLRVSVVPPKPSGASRRSLPALVVMTMMVFSKLTVLPVRVGNPAVVENLQQDVEHVGVRLFNFVKEDDANRACGAPFR